MVLAAAIRAHSCKKKTLFGGIYRDISMKYSGFGLDVDFTDSSWSWTLSGENSIMFHGTICLLYVNSVVALQRFMNGKAVEGFAEHVWHDATFIHEHLLNGGL